MWEWHWTQWQGSCFGHCSFFWQVIQTWREHNGLYSQTRCREHHISHQTAMQIEQFHSHVLSMLRCTCVVLGSFCWSMVSLIVVNRASDNPSSKVSASVGGRSWSNVTMNCSFLTAPFKPCRWYGKNTTLTLNRGFFSNAKRLALSTKNSSKPSSIRSNMSTSSSIFLLFVRGSSFGGFRSAFLLSCFMLRVLRAPPVWLSRLKQGTLLEWSNSMGSSSSLSAAFLWLIRSGTF